MAQRALADTAAASAERLFNIPLFTIARTPVTAMTLVVFLAIAILAFWASRLAGRATKRGFALRGVIDEGTTGAAARLVQYVVMLLGMGVALQTLGIDLNALFAASAFFAVALGFAMQNVAQNFVSGVILLTERTIKPGDILQVEDRVVRVTRMGLRSTVARTRDDEDLIIPNSVLVANTVTNYTLRDAVYRIRATVGVSYEADLDVVTRILSAAASELPERFTGRDPRVLLTGFGDSSVNFEVSVWIQDPWSSRVNISALNHYIWRGLRNGGISIPFPQRDMHVISLPEKYGADYRVT
ncbi:MAG: mechanosensitive ion channel domain-containing protein [Gemmatimonadaceae bacterium]